MILCVFPLQAIFLAHGPAFKEGYLAPAFDNIQIYNLLCGEYDLACSVLIQCVNWSVHVTDICAPFDKAGETQHSVVLRGSLTMLHILCTTTHPTPTVMGHCSKACDSKAQLYHHILMNSTLTVQWGG